MRKTMAMIVAAMAAGLVFGTPVEKPNDPKVHHDKNRNWKIVYGRYEGCEARAVEFLSTELGALIQRDPGIYSLHVVACEKAGEERETRKSAIVTGTRGSNALLAKHLRPEDVPAGGYVVKVIEDGGRQLVLCCGDTPAASIWAAVDFIDDGLATMRIHRGDGERYTSEIFEQDRLGAYESRRAPKTATRSIFSWANKMGDYRTYFRNMARCKFNEVILWNDYPPLNAREVADYARSWGVRVLWGWSWGWGPDCEKAYLGNTEAIADGIVRAWHEKWKPCGGDGIYFQSFTETTKETLNGHSIPEAVVKVVNSAAKRILAEDPDLRIVFGLHAWSMKKHLDVFAKTDPRLEILWENCGGFPFNAWDDEPEADTTATCRGMLDMKGRKTGFAYKWQLISDWSRFVFQAGPYVLGRNAPSVIEHDRRIYKELWQELSTEWILNGERAWRLTRMIQAHPDRGSLNVVVNFNAPVHLPTALVAEMFWSADEPWPVILRRVLNRGWMNAEATDR